MSLTIDIERVSRPIILPLTIITIFLYLIYHHFLKLAPIFQFAKEHNIPIVGFRKDDWLPYTQAKWRNFLDFRSAALEADRLSRTAPATNPNNHHQAVILPVFGTPNFVHLPRSETQFIVDQPESILSLHDQVLDNLQLDFILPDPHLVHDPVHHKIITTLLTSQIGNLVPDLADETEWAFKRYWGNPITEFKEVLVYDTLRSVIAEVTGRIFVGAPLCRNEELLKTSISYADSLPLTSNFLVWIWKPVKPLVAVFASLPARIKHNRFVKLVRPEIIKRLAEYDARHADPGAEKAQNPDTLEPENNDLLQWFINQAKASGDPYMFSPTTLAGRVLLVIFAGIHTSSFTIAHALLDIAYSPARAEIISALRAEISSCLAAYLSDNKPLDGDSIFTTGEWNKTALNNMHKLDSLLRESSRLNSFVAIGLGRKVVSPAGLTTPLSRVTVPQGCEVVVPSYPVFHCPETYPDPEEFRPFRFAEQRRDEGEAYVKRAGKAFASTGCEYLAFGHGRNACPGRFFVASELKLVLGYVVMNYEIEPVVGAGGDGKVKRPENKWFGHHVVPDFGAKIRIRRRDAV